MRVNPILIWSRTLSLCRPYISVHPKMVGKSSGAPVVGYCPFFFLGDIAFFLTCIIAISFCTEIALYVFLPDGVFSTFFFYHGLDFDISLCENSINQQKKTQEI